MKYLLPISLLALYSCSNLRSPHKQIAEARTKIAKEYNAEIDKQEYGVKASRINLTWNQALDKLLYHNPNILRANFRIEDSIIRTKQVWKDMIPSLRASISDSATIGEISELFIDTNLRVNSFISLGNIIELPKRIVTNKFNVIASELQAEQVMRNEVIALYRLFQEQRLHDLEAEAIRYEREFLNVEVEDKNSFTYQDKLKSILEKEKELQEKRNDWVAQINDLYMGDFTHVNLKYSTLPTIKYSPKNLDFRNSKRWANLQLNLLAIERISEESNIKQAYNRYYPDGFLSVTAPPLFSNNSNQDFRFEDFRLTPSLSWSLDTRDSIGQQIDRIRRDSTIKRWEADKRRQQEVRKLLDGKKALTEVQKEISEVQTEIKEYQSLVSSGNVIDLDLFQSVSEIVGMRSNEITLKAKEIDICTSFWLIDETRWVKTTKKWKRARLEQEKARKEKYKDNIPFFRKKFKGE